MTTGETTIVALAGPTCAYKTTLMGLLVAEFDPKPTTLSFDEYDLYPSGSESMEQELRSPKITNWEDPALFDEEAYVEDLARLAQGLPVTLKARSRESLAANVGHRTLHPNGLVIVEGIFTFRDSRTLGLIGLKVFMDLSEDVYVARRLKAALTRQDEGPWHSPDYITGPMVKGTRRYVMSQRDNADLVVDAIKPPKELASIITDRIKQMR